jgi:hypothetical protein
VVALAALVLLTVAGPAAGAGAPESGSSLSATAADAADATVDVATTGELSLAAMDGAAAETTLAVQADGSAYVGGADSLSTDLTSSSSGCRTARAWIGLKNILGMYLWKYFQKLGWCWKGGSVTSATPRCEGTWAEVYAPVWDFKGHIGCQYGGGVGQSFVRRWRQGKFQLCTTICIQTKTPWVNVRGTGTGLFYWSTGGV